MGRRRGQARALGVANQESHYCESCREYFDSLTALQRHNTKVHKPWRFLGPRLCFDGPMPKPKRDENMYEAEKSQLGVEEMQVRVLITQKEQSRARKALRRVTIGVEEMQVRVLITQKEQSRARKALYLATMNTLNATRAKKNQ